MAASRIVMMTVLLAVFLTHGTHAFTWTSAIQHGANLSRCVGENVTFPWSYATEHDENVIVQFWFSRNNGSFASHFAGYFRTSNSRVTETGNAGLTLSDVKLQDKDTYGVSVRLEANLEPMTQNATLSVMEPPRTTDGQLRIKQHEMEAGNTSCWHMRLTCGKFVSLGTPRATVLWTDPAGRTLQSTHFQDGLFSLRLSPFANGGNYTCYLPTTSATCLPSDSPLLLGASVLVETLASVVSQHTEDLGALGQEVKQLKFKGDNGVTGDVIRLQDAVEALNATMEQNLQEHSQHDADIRQLLQRLTEMETVSPGQADTVSNLQSLVNQQVRTIQDQNTQLSRLQGQTTDQNTQISSLQSQVTEQNTQISNLQSQVTDQNTQISSLQSQVTDQNTQISELKKQLSDLITLTTDQRTQTTSLQKENTDQTTQISGLKNQVRDQNTQISDLQKENTDQNTQIASLQKQNADQNTQISGLQKQSTDQDTQISSLQNQVTDQNTQVSGLKSQVSDLRQVTTNQNAHISQLANTLANHVTTATREHEKTATQLGVMEGNVTSLLMSYGDTVTSMEEVMRQLEQQNVTELPHMASLQAKVDSLQTNVSQWMSTQASLQADLWDVRARVSKLHPVRLVGGASAWEGRVELLVGNQWGTVCDDAWDTNDAMVICGMLGYSRVGAVARVEAAFGQGSGPVVLDDVVCSGNETDIRLCVATVFGSHNCQHTEDAGVVCQP